MRQLKIVLEWVEIHKTELMQGWKLARDNHPLNLTLLVITEVLIITTAAYIETNFDKWIEENIEHDSSDRRKKQN